MEKEVIAFINKQQLFHRGATVLVGVSGGPDSMALLHFLQSIQEEWGFRLIALTADHGLRGEQSKEDLLYVKDMCRKWNVECYETFLDVNSYKTRTGKGTQVAARDLRYQYFEEQMNRFSADFLALGHHGDDQAETILMRIVRNANPDGLSGMPVKRSFGGGFIVRPLLCLSKEDIEMYCRDHQIIPRRDPSNEEDSYTRNYYRIHILPLLKEQNPKLHKNMQRLSELVTADENFLNEEAKKMMDKVVSLSGKAKKAVFDLEIFKTFPFALQRRSFHLILNYLYHSVPADLSYVHEEQFFNLLHSQQANSTVDFPAGLKMAKEYQIIKFSFGNSKGIPYQEQLEVPGQVVLPDGSVIIASVLNHRIDESIDTMTCEMTDIESPLLIRTRQPGDRIRVRGLNGRKKVKDIFIDEKTPLNERDQWPVVTDAKGKIIWLAGLKKAALEEKGKAERFLHLQYKKKGNT